MLQQRSKLKKLPLPSKLPQKQKLLPRLPKQKLQQLKRLPLRPKRQLQKLHLKNQLLNFLTGSFPCGSESVMDTVAMSYGKPGVQNKLSGQDGL